MLILAVASLPALIAMLGLTVDVGRLYVARAELQAFVDSAATAACYELDGTALGITNARAVATAGPGSGASVNRWDFATKTVASVQIAFSQTSSGAYETSPASGTGYRFIRVTASGPVPLYFVRVLPGVVSPRTVSATAIAGQGAQSSIGDGVAPFSPDAHDNLDLNFGFAVGQQYTLKWAPPGQRDKNFCAGDKGFLPGGGSSERGYIDVGQGNGNSALHDAIVNNDYNLAMPLTVGSLVIMVQGNKSVPDAIDERFNQDSDTTAATYSDYHGNGRRIIVVPVNDRGDPAVVVGFASFFVPPNSCGDKNNTPCCGEYLGSALKYSTHQSAGGPGLYAVKLFR